MRKDCHKPTYIGATCLVLVTTLDMALLALLMTLLGKAMTSFLRMLDNVQME